MLPSTVLTHSHSLSALRNRALEPQSPPSLYFLPRKNRQHEITGRMYVCRVTVPYRTKIRVWLGIGRPRGARAKERDAIVIQGYMYIENDNPEPGMPTRHCTMQCSAVQCAVLCCDDSFVRLMNRYGGHGMAWHGRGPWWWSERGNACSHRHTARTIGRSVAYL